MKFLICLLFLLSCNRFTTWSTPEGGDFKLKTPNGILDTEKLRGKTVFIFFGFLHCPNVCPTTVHQLNRFAKSISERRQKSIAMVFVTVDPKRDTPEKLKEHFSHLHPSFIPAYGTEEEIRKAMKLYGGDFKTYNPEKPDEMVIDHTSSIFVINRQGIWVNSLAYDSSVDDLKNALAISTSQKPYWSAAAKAERLKVLGGNEDCDLGKEDCFYVTPSGEKFDVTLSPRPIHHLEKSKITVRSKNERLTPKVGDFVGVELAMGLIRPVLYEEEKGVWSGEFILPTCDLRDMNWKLRLLLQDSEQENYEITYKFSSINLNPHEEESKR
jgi:protein SCO1